MDTRDESASNAPRYKQDLEQQSKQNIDDSKNWVVEDGKKFRLPYKMIKQVVLSNVSKSDMIDQEHAARLQYRLLLLEPVIKAYVEFQKGRITIIYNPIGADNIREKMSLDDIIAFLSKEGISVDRSAIAERDYDYYKEFYSYAFHPKVIREHPPYGYTLEQWRKMKPKWEEKSKEYEKKKWLDFKKYQKGYEEKHPEVYAKPSQ